LARPIKSVDFRLQNLARPGLRARIVAAWANSQSTLRAAGSGAGARQHTGASAATPATGLRRLFLCFVFLGGLRRPVAGVAGAALPSCCVCWWAVSLLWRSRKPRRRVAPRQHSVAALALAGWRPAQLPFWTQAEGAAKRSGAASRPGNEVFALLGGTGTGQCPVVGHRHHALIVLTGREGRRRPSWRTAWSVGSMERSNASWRRASSVGADGKARRPAS
jgi:hypothetical protein